jgi:16S rRNA C967 or C1407 C5-methylase (RsmB/RsmF family)/NOL1/NOP2/fmu family ribosome biogenesis protein
MALPQALVQQLKDFGVDVDALLNAHLRQAHTAIRLNSRKPLDIFVEENTVPWCANGKYLKEKPSFILDPIWHAGNYYVQEASSMFLAYALQQKIDCSQALRVIDLCAAPGGKSTLVADLLNDDSLLISNEVISTRVAPLAENLMKWGRVNTWVSNSDPVHFAKLKHYADVLLIDAPCSGSGLLRKDENYEQEWSEANVKLCAQRQQRILNDAWDCLKPNGILVYMTCSFSPAENEEILDWIIDTFKCSSLQIEVPTEFGIAETQSSKHNCFGYRFYPHLLQGEGFFLAMFQKGDEEIVKEAKCPSLKFIKDKSIFQQLISANEVEILEDNANNFIALPIQFVKDYEQIKNCVKLVRKGVLLGSLAKNKVLPAHDIALSLALNKSYPSLELTKTQALQYLAKQDFFIEAPQKGSYVVTYLQQPLGFINHLGNRINNNFPAHLRVRKRIE